MDVQIRKQRRKSLAFKFTPSGAAVLIPLHLDEDSPEVQQFIADAVAALPVPGTCPMAGIQQLRIRLSATRI